MRVANVATDRQRSLVQNHSSGVVFLGAGQDARDVEQGRTIRCRHARARDVTPVDQSHHRFEPLASLAQVTMHQPEPPQRQRQTCGDSHLAMIDCPAQRGAQVGMLVFQPRQRRSWSR